MLEKERLVYYYLKKIKDLFEYVLKKGKDRKKFKVEQRQPLQCVQILTSCHHQCRLPAPLERN